MKHLEDLVWKCIHGVHPAYLGDLCVPVMHGHVWSRELALCIQTNLTNSVRSDCSGPAKFRRQWTDHLEQSTLLLTERAPELSQTQNAFTRALKTHLFSTARHR